MMKLLLPFFLSLSYAYACFVPPESWNWSDEELVGCSASIVMAKYDGKKFSVQEAIKGSLKKDFKFKVNSVNEPSASHILAGITPDCKLLTSFQKNKSYLVFQHAHHPKGYLPVKGSRDKWLLHVKSILQKNLPAPKCLEVPKEIRP